MDACDRLMPLPEPTKPAVTVQKFRRHVEEDSDESSSNSIRSERYSESYVQARQLTVTLQSSVSLNGTSKVPPLLHSPDSSSSSLNLSVDSYENHHPEKVAATAPVGQQVHLGSEGLAPLHQQLFPVSAAEPEVSQTLEGSPVLRGPVPPTATGSTLAEGVPSTTFGSSVPGFPSTPSSSVQSPTFSSFFGKRVKPSDAVSHLVSSKDASTAAAPAMEASPAAPLQPSLIATEQLSRAEKERASPSAPSTSLGSVKSVGASFSVPLSHKSKLPSPRPSVAPSSSSTMTTVASAVKRPVTSLAASSSSTLLSEPRRSSPPRPLVSRGPSVKAEESGDSAQFLHGMQYNRVARGGGSSIPIREVVARCSRPQLPAALVASSLGTRSVMSNSSVQGGTEEVSDGLSVVEKEPIQRVVPPQRSAPVAPVTPAVLDGGGGVIPQRIHRFTDAASSTEVASAARHSSTGVRRANMGASPHSVLKNTLQPSSEMRVQRQYQNASLLPHDDRLTPDARRLMRASIDEVFVSDDHLCRHSSPRTASDQLAEWLLSSSRRSRTEAGRPGMRPFADGEKNPVLSGGRLSYTTATPLMHSSDCSTYDGEVLPRRAAPSAPLSGRRAVREAEKYSEMDVAAMASLMKHYCTDVSIRGGGG